jgi:PAS domain S-box-containing protein
MPTNPTVALTAETLMPHGHDYLWQPELLWLHGISDSVIALSYITIPVTLIYLVRKRHDVPFGWMVGCCVMFLLSCGLTHGMAVWTLWYPTYWMAGALKAITAVSSLCTALLLMALMPRLVSLPSPRDLQRSAEALERSEARFRVAAESSLDAFYILDTVRDDAGAVVDFKYVYLNSRARARLVDKTMPVEGRRISELFPASALKDLYQRYQRVVDEHRPLDEELPIKLPNHEATWLHLQIVPLETGVAVTSRDISQRKREVEALRRAEEQFRGLLESAPDAMVIVDNTGHIVFTNAQTQRVFGYVSKELLGERVEILLPHRHHGTHVGHRSDYFSDPKARAMGPNLELNGRRKDGSEFPIEIRLSPLHTDSGLLVSSAIRDISSRKLIENALKLSNQELEAFSYTVAHDLRAPLRGMSGFAEILLEDYAAKLDAEGQDCLREILHNTQRMSGLIDSLLSLSRVARSELRLETVELSELAGRVANDLTTSEPERAVAIVVQPGLCASMDRDLAGALLANLLGNAWKFTSRVSTPRIEFGVTDQQGSPTFFVRDNGAGFDMAFARKLFAPFERLHSANEFPGTGIGLATVERIVQRHGGRIWAEGTVNAGATFYFRVPARAPGAST